jgi:hypothetical protein
LRGAVSIIDAFYAIFVIDEIRADLLTLKNLPIPARSCLLSRSFCKVISADTFLISITVWSTLNFVWTVGTTMYYAIETCKP